MKIECDYTVAKPFGNFKKGDLLRMKKKEHLKVIKRKLQEGDETVIPFGKKMNTEKYENKMIKDSDENKKKEGK